MTAQAADRQIVRREGETFEFPVAAGVTCYIGAIAVLDSSGNVKPGVTATGLIPAGVFTAQVDNSTGSAADVTATVQPGTFRFGNSAGGDEITKAEIGDTCYLVDDQTVAKTNGSSTRSAAGQIVDVDTSGVWVRVGMDRLIPPPPPAPTWAGAPTRSPWSSGTSAPRGLMPPCCASSRRSPAR